MIAGRFEGTQPPGETRASAVDANGRLAGRSVRQAGEMTTDGAGRAPRLAESTRVEAFSDGVFAIALTLLVLDLHSPVSGHGGFARALLDQWPAYVAYLAAFLNIAAIWLNHHELFTLVRRVDARLICANLLLLLITSLFPWPAAVISAAVRDGNHADQVAATVLYAVMGFLVPLAWIVVYRYLSHSPHLLTDAAATGYARHGVGVSVRLLSPGTRDCVELAQRRRLPGSRGHSIRRAAVGPGRIRCAAILFHHDRGAAVPRCSARDPNRLRGRSASRADSVQARSRVWVTFPQIRPKQ